MNSFAADVAAALPLASIVIAFLIPLVSLKIKNPMVPHYISSVVTGLVFLLSAYVFIHVFSTGDVLVYTFSGFPPPLGIVYVVDVVNSFVGFLIGFVFFFVNIFSLKYILKFGGSEWYYTLMLGLEAGLMGLAYTGDVFNVFVMMEVASVSTYALITFFRERGYPLDAGVKYGILGGVATTIYFVAAVIAYYSFGTLNMADIASKILGRETPFNTFSQGFTYDVGVAAVIFLGLSVWTFAIESALFPMHFWLPEAYTAAPATAAAALAAVAEGTYVYLVMRYIYTIVGLEHALPVRIAFLFLGSLAVIFAGFLMSQQNGLKRIISYSTVLDVGFMYIGLGIGSKLAIAATLYYILSHAFVKPLLFLTAAASEYLFGTTNLNKLSGVYRKYPILGASLAVGGLAVAGVLPFNLFFAKLNLAIAALQEGYAPVIIVIAVGSAFALVSFSRALYATYFKPGSAEVSSLTLPVSFKSVLSILLVLTVITGLGYTLINTDLITPIAENLTDSTLRLKYLLTVEEILSAGFK